MPAWGEAPRRDAQEVETIMATADPESPASTEHLMEAICDPDNIEAALDAVVRNKGAPGIDGITVKQLPDILKARWPEIEDQLLQGRYQPQPVRRATGAASPTPDPRLIEPPRRSRSPTDEHHEIEINLGSNLKIDIGQ
jgi:hypothetical protein